MCTQLFCGPKFCQEVRTLSHKLNREYRYRLNKARLHLFPPNASLDYLHPTFTELPFLSTWGEGEENEERKEGEFFDHLILNMKFLEHFPVPIVRTIWSPEYISSLHFINHVVAGTFFITSFH
jgi:hypothetical protein